MRKVNGVGLIFILCTLFVIPYVSAAADITSASAIVKTDAQTAEELGLLIGEGNGVTAAYLAKETTRMQAAIISLRLQGKVEEALAYKGNTNFADAGLVSKGNQAVLAYIKDHPEYGWTGIGNGKFDPLAPISSQQLYKVLLESMGYKAGVDFQYKDTEKFAADKGLVQIGGTAALRNSNVATAMVEALYATTPQGETMLVMLQLRGVIPSSASLTERIGLRTDAQLGTYFTDGEGRTLYVFTRDAQDLNSCKGECIANWPVFASDQLQIPSSMNTADFSVLTRTDGTKQWMYKGWPLYYFVKDAKAGDVFGEGVNDVWFVIDPAKFTGTKAAAQQKTYNVDIKEYSFGSGPLTVEAGSKIIFTNYDDMQHNAVATDGSFSTKLLSKGESASITLDKPGVYDYYCEPHKNFMYGQIIVK